MISPQDIKSHFHLKTDEYIGEVYVIVTSRNPELRRAIMNGISFDTYDNTLIYEARPENPNTLTISRQIYIKEKNDLKK
jgi:hypothetical protein